MKRILALALAALVSACGSDKKEKPITYAGPQAPTASEQSAVASAGATLQANLSYQGSTQPTAGAAGLGDQLASSLGGSTISAKTTSASSAKLAGPALREAFDTSGLDPACVTTAQAGNVTTVTWGAAAPCHVVVSSSDPTTGDALTMTVDVTGTLTWDPTQGLTAWNIGEGYAMDMTSGGQRMTADGTAHIGGSLKVDASTITVNETSSIDMTTHYMGLTVPEGLVTTLAGTVGYQASPFCITSGTLTVEQRWTQRPIGATDQTLPNQGWRFDWTGCGAFTVAHGS
jgi:hypothetical protein